MALQPTLFDATEARPELAPLRPERLVLDDESWVDQQIGWVGGALELHLDLERTIRWRQGTRILFDNEVVEPRLSGGLSDPGRHRVVARIADALSRHYGARFDTTFLNLYRNGDDAVAWHRDRIHRRQARPLVAIITLGSARRFLMRPRGGGTAVRFRPGPGDLLVMGGRSQHDWEHCVPRSVRVTSPRISLTLRPSVDPPT